MEESMNLIPHVEKDPHELTVPGHRGNNGSHSEVSQGASC